MISLIYRAMTLAGCLSGSGTVFPWFGSVRKWARVTLMQKKKKDKAETNVCIYVSSANPQSTFWSKTLPSDTSWPKSYKVSTIYLSSSIKLSLTFFSFNLTSFCCFGVSWVRSGAIAQPTEKTGLIVCVEGVTGKKVLIQTCNAVT